MLIGTQELIHDINTKLILTHIINTGPISRATLAKKSGLTKATVSAIVQELIDKQLILELGSDNTSRGRKPILLDFNPSCGHVISVDLDEEELTILTCHLDGSNGQIIHYPNNKPTHEILDYLERLIHQTLKALPPTYYGVVGICIGIHGVVNQNQILFTPYAPYAGIDFVTLLEDSFSIPVYLENEANLSIIGEKTFCYDYANMIGISIHSGIGLGLIIHHELFSGYSGSAGEFGHTIVELNGLPCPCGNQGCFEQYASERALLLQFAKRKQLTKANLRMFTTAYTQKDPDAICLVQQFVQYMAVGINNILNFLNPEIIVINSALVTEFPTLLEEIASYIKGRTHTAAHLVPSGLPHNSILLGGVCVCTKNFLGLKYLNFQSTCFSE